MIDFSKEHAVSFAEAARLLPGRPHIATLWRWHSRGVRGVRLETIVIGGRRFTTTESLQRFADRLTNPNQRAPDVSPGAHALAVKQAEKILDAAGI